MRRHALWSTLFTFLIAIALTAAIYFGLLRQRDTVVFSVGAFVLGVAALGANAYLTWILATEHERHPKNKSFLKALQNFFAHKPAKGALWQIVEGKLTQTRAAEGGVAGPAEIIIPKDHAIVFEDKTSKFTHAEFGPGNYQAHPSDDLAQSIIVITRPQFKRLAVQNLATKDGIVLDRIDFSIFYHLKTDPSQYRSDNLQYPITQENLTQAVYAVTFGEDEQHKPITTWESAVQETAKNSLRAEVSGRALSQFFMSDKSPSPTSEIAGEAQKHLNEIVGRWGVVVEALNIVHVAIPAPIQKKLEEKWVADRSQEIKKAEGVAEGKKIEEIERYKTIAWEYMSSKMRESFGTGMELNLLATQYIEILQYLDSLVRIAQLSPPRAIMPAPQQMDALLRGFEERFRRAAETQESVTQESPTPSSTVVEHHPNATIVGTPTDDESARKGDSPPDTSASGAVKK